MTVPLAGVVPACDEGEVVQAASSRDPEAHKATAADKRLHRRGTAAAAVWDRVTVNRAPLDGRGRATVTLYGNGSYFNLRSSSPLLTSRRTSVSTGARATLISGVPGRSALGRFPWAGSPPTESARLSGSGTVWDTTFRPM